MAMGYIRTPKRNKLHDDKIIAGVEWTFTTKSLLGTV